MVKTPTERKYGNRIPFWIQSVLEWLFPGFGRYQRDQRKIVSLAGIDPLTGLNTRLRAQERFEMAVAESLEGSGSVIVGIAFIDIDFFKKINDQYGGHRTGDRVLRRISFLLGSFGILSRWGGDEFAIFFVKRGDNGRTEILSAIEAILRVIREDSELHLNYSRKRTYKVTLSIGVVCGSISQMNEIELFLKRGLEKADEAVYLAKAYGRNQFAVFEGELGDQTDPKSATPSTS